MAENSVKLSCEQCKSRKTKCDKGSPCSACRVGGLTCRPVQRQRLPRGKTGKVKSKNSALEGKVARLEGLVKGLEAQAHANGDESGGHTQNGQVRSPSLGNRVEKFVARDFWLALINEVSRSQPRIEIYRWVHSMTWAAPGSAAEATKRSLVSGLREVLEQSDEEDDDADTSQTSSLGLPFLSLSSNALLFGPAGHGAVPHPSPSMRAKFLQLYRNRVDCLFKVLHWPSFCDALSRRTTDMYDPADSRPLRALEYAVYFMALCSTTPADFEDLQMIHPAGLISQYRKATEILLSEAGLLTTTDLTVLQAFVIYLAGVRTSGDAWTTWTLLALAVRIADACGLGNNSIPATSALEAESCRRLWSSLALVDSQTAVGRGSEPLLEYQHLQCVPANVNDSEMSLNYVPRESSTAFTDMSFPWLTHHANLAQRKLIDPAYGGWTERLEAARAFEAFTFQHYAHFESSTVPLHRYTAIVAKGMAKSIHLLIRRPPYKNMNTVVPANDDFDVLEAACSTLESGLHKRVSTDFAVYSWFAWPKWYALAVVLVDLCHYPRGPKFDRFYEIAKQSYDQYAQSASDVHSGLLWRPLVKIMRRLQRTMGKTDAQDTPRQADGQVHGVSEKSQSMSDAPNGPVSMDITNSGLCPKNPVDDSQMLGLDDLWLGDDATWYQWDSFLGQMG